MNFNNLEMASTVSTHTHIHTKKTLFGLRTTLVYQPTQSPVDAFRLELTPDEGRRLQELLRTDVAQLEEAVKKKGKVRTTTNGNMCVELCLARDNQFAAVQLFQFRDFSYHPVGDIRISEGYEAEVLSRLFR